MRHFSGEFEGLKLLMLDELEMIAGGEGEDTDDVPPPPDPNGDIVVTASRNDWDSGTWDLFNTYFNNIDFTGSAAGGSGGGSGGSEGGIDGKACEAAEAIKSQPNYANQEYGYFIISDASGDRLSQMFTSGQDGRIDFGGPLNPALLGAADWSQVKGFIHNHPSQEDYSFIPGDPNQMNRMPSPADWDIADQISSRSGSTGSDFRNYVIGPDGVTRQYDVGDSRTKVSTDESGGNC